MTSLVTILFALTYVGMALGAAHLAWQIWVVDLNDPKDCLRIFKSNRVFGWTLLLAVIAGQIVR